MRAPSPLAPVDPETAGPFRLLGRLAAGGMGDVYLGREAGRPDSLVAVKLLRRDLAHDPAFRQRFEAEVRASFRVARRPATVTHVARVVAADVDADPAWLATEFVPGPTVADAARDEPLAGERLLDVARSLAEALAAMHSEGLVHGDVKPANVVLGPDGVRLVDLGLTHELGIEPDGPVMGSPGWSPPERGREPSRPAGDVFGWGLTVAYAATAQHPFGTGGPDAISRRMRTSPPDLSRLPEPLRGAVAAALAREPRHRPRAEEIATLLASAPHVGASTAVVPVPADATGPLLAPTSVETLLHDDEPGTVYDDDRAAEHRWWMAVAGVAVVLVMCLGLWLLGVVLLQPGATPAQASTPAGPSGSAAATSADASSSAAPTATASPTRATAAAGSGAATSKATGATGKDEKKGGNGKGEDKKKR